MDDLRDYIRLCAKTSRQIVLYDLIEKRYGERPYGWPELEVVLLVARMAVMKEIHLTVEGAPLPLDRAYEPLTSSRGQRKVIISQRESADSDLIQKSQALGKDLFSQMGPASEEALFVALRDQFLAWQADLKRYETLTATGRYPGKSEIESSLDSLGRFVDEADSLRFLRRFVKSKPELLELEEDIQELRGFYNDQKRSWEELRHAVEILKPNRMQLGAQESAAQAVARMEEILAMPRPYPFLSEAAGLIEAAKSANEALVLEARKPVTAEIQKFLSTLQSDLDSASVPDAARQAVTQELEGLLAQVAKETSIAHISQAQGVAEEAFDRALTALEKAQAPPEPGPEGGAAPDTPAPPPVKKRRVVEAKSLMSEEFIETAEELEAFLRKLRTEIEAALADDDRVQIK